MRHLNPSASDHARLRGIDRGHHPHLGGVDVLFTVRDVGDVVAEQRAVENRALADFHRPDLFAGVDLQRVIHAIGTADEQRARAVDVGNDGRGIIRVVVTRLRRADPDRLAALLVEREVAVAGPVEIAPREDQRVEDDLVALDDRRRGSAAVRGHRAVLVGERSIPQHLAVRRHADQLRRDGEQVDVAGLRIDRGRRPRRAMLRHVAQEQAEAPLPHHFAGFRIDRDQPFLRRRGIARRRRIDVNAIAKRHRSRPAADRECARQGCRPAATSGWADWFPPTARLATARATPASRRRTSAVRLAATTIAVSAETPQK